MLKRLISQFQQSNSHQAFEQIVRACQSELRAYCRRLTAGDYALANDIAQESLIIAYQQLGRLKNQQAFKSWLYRIAYRQYLGYLRTARQHDNVDVIEQGLENAEPGLDEKLNQERLIYQLFSKLTPSQRAVITLHLSLGYSQSEISGLLNMPLGTVKSHCTRAKDVMQKHLPSCYKGVA